MDASEEKRWSDTPPSTLGIEEIFRACVRRRREPNPPNSAPKGCRRRHPHALARLPRRRELRWVVYTALIWGVLYWGTRTNSQFIYFQF